MELWKYDQDISGRLRTKFTERAEEVGHRSLLCGDHFEITHLSIFPLRLQEQLKQN